MQERFKSVGIQTNLIFHRFSGIIETRDAYVVVKTPSRPGFFWGNFIIMPNPPKEEDFQTWTEIFEREIGARHKTGFMTFTWDDPNGVEGELGSFKDFGFTLSKSVMLTSTSVNRPSKYNESLTIKPLESDEEWSHYADIHFDPEWEYGSPEGQRKFLSDEASHLRKMVEAGMGCRFGAFVENRPIAELGVYWDGIVARFSNVGTHRDFRRLGACSTLVHHASRYVLERSPKITLVMAADPEYHAAKIYESVGFRPTQQLCELEWYDPKMMK